jgi:hypothetical protein
VFALEFVGEGVCVSRRLIAFEDGSKKAEWRIESPSRVDGTCTRPSPDEGKFGPAARPERRLISSRPDR